MSHCGGVMARCENWKVARSFLYRRFPSQPVRLHRAKEGSMIAFFGKTGRGLAVAAAILAAIGLTAVTRPADAGGGWSGGGISPGAAVGLGLGAFALGSVLSQPYYSPYYYPYYGYYGYYRPAPAYYPPASYYPPARSCWSPAYGYYYAC